MSRVPFEIWAAEAVQRLRAEADALDVALSVYLKATDAVEVDNAAPGVSPARSAASLSRNIINRLAEVEEPPLRRSKYDRLVEVFTRRTGDAGLTLNAMMRIAEEQGMPLQRHHLRSLIFYQKTRGNVEVHGDFYRWRTFPAATEGAHEIEENQVSEADEASNTSGDQAAQHAA